MNFNHETLTSKLNIGLNRLPVFLISRQRQRQYNHAKWKLWYGKPKNSLELLNELKNKLTDVFPVKKIDELIFYINNNIVAGA